MVLVGCLEVLKGYLKVLIGCFSPGTFEENPASVGLGIKHERHAAVEARLVHEKVYGAASEVPGGRRKESHHNKYISNGFGGIWKEMERGVIYGTTTGTYYTLV